MYILRKNFQLIVKRVCVQFDITNLKAEEIAQRTPWSPSASAVYSFLPISLKTPLCLASGLHIWKSTVPSETNHAQNDTTSASAGIAKSVLSHDRDAPCCRKLDVVEKSEGKITSVDGRFNYNWSDEMTIHWKVRSPQVLRFPHLASYVIRNYFLIFVWLNFHDDWKVNSLLPW